MEFTGSSEKTQYTFKIIRKKGTQVEVSPPLCGSPATVVSIDEDGVETTKQAMLPGPVLFK